MKIGTIDALWENYQSYFVSFKEYIIFPVIQLKNTAKTLTIVHKYISCDKKLRKLTKTNKNDKKLSNNEQKLIKIKQEECDARGTQKIKISAVILCETL